MLRGFGISVEYNRRLRVESQIEASLLRRTENHDGLFLPPHIVEGRHVFCATHSGMVKRSKERLVLTGNLNFDRNDCNFLVTIFQLPIITREGSKYRLLYKV